MELIELKDVDFEYQNGNKILSDFDLSISSGEFVCLLGESGCGKSTVLRLMTGLEQAQNGEIKIDDKIINAPSSSTGVVFQKPSLIPWLNVRQNIELGYKLRNEQISNEETTEILKLVGIENTEKLKPNELSGGMAQRVAIARALVGGANPLLMDEPFGALDALTRLRLQDELYHIWESTKKTILFITHDIDEAIFFSDRIILMEAETKGIAQVIQNILPRPRERESKEYIEKHIEVKSKLFELIKNKNGQ